MQSNRGAAKRRGIALLFVFSVSVILAGLAISWLALHSNENRARERGLQAIQAYWNARAGLERYCQERRLPADGVYSFDKGNRCVVSREQGDLLFQGVSGGQSRTLRLGQGDPSLRREEWP